MSQLSTCGVLNCSDSPLSITGNVIGILTLAYAIVITFVYRAKDLATAKDEKNIFDERARRAHSSLVDAQERLKAYFSTFQLPMSKEIEMLLADAERWQLKYREEFLGETSSNRMMSEGAAYIVGKDELNTIFEGMVQTRATLDGTYHVLLNSMIINEIRKQKATSEKQISMISKVMRALDLEVPAESPEEPDAPAKNGAIDMIEMYLRSSEQSKQEPSPPTPRRTIMRDDIWIPTAQGSYYDPDTGTRKIPNPYFGVKGSYIGSPYALWLREKLDGLSKIFRK